MPDRLSHVRRADCHSLHISRASPDPVPAPSSPPSPPTQAIDVVSQREKGEGEKGTVWPDQDAHLSRHRCVVKKVTNQMDFFEAAFPHAGVFHIYYVNIQKHQDYLVTLERR